MNRKFVVRAPQDMGTDEPAARSKNRCAADWAAH